MTPLSPRQLEVLKMLADGKLNKQIASELGISIKTVEKHRQNLLDKRGHGQTAAGMCCQAMRDGLIQ